MPDRDGPPAYKRQPLYWGGQEIRGVCPIQLGGGGLLDWEPHGATPIHLVRSTRHGTPGTLLCGLDQHTLPVGFSVRGGTHSPSLGDADPATAPCPVCVQVAARMALGVEQFVVSDGVGGDRITRAIAAELDRMGATEFTSVGRYQIWEDWRAQQAFATGGDPR